MEWRGGLERCDEVGTFSFSPNVCGVTRESYKILARDLCQQISTEHRVSYVDIHESDHHAYHHG